MDDDILVITFKGSQTIEKAEIIKNTLVEAIKGKKKEILINLDGLEKIDLSFLQLLYSASLEAVSKKKKISISGDVPDAFLDMVKLSGFNRIIGTDSNHLLADLKKIEE